MNILPSTLLLTSCFLAASASLTLGFMVAAMVWFISAGFNFIRLQILEATPERVRVIAV